jgi:uncharacterized protein
MNITVNYSIKDINKDQWIKLTESSNSFHDYDWLKNLEDSLCTTEKTGWIPRYFIAHKNNKIIAAIVSYIKTHSYAEYIFDWQWAQSYYQADINYYPKLVLASAFSPVTNKRILSLNETPQSNLETLLKFVINYAKEHNMSSIHSLFCPKEELKIYENLGFKTRLSYQFHFQNQNYSSFNDYVNNLKSQKRKTISKEREFLQTQKIKTHFYSGNDITKKELEFVWTCYKNTTLQKGSTAYLNKEFFLNLSDSLKKQILIIIASQNNTYCASTFNLFKNNYLYGRYWGSTLPIKFLHFECSLYQLINWGIQHNINIIEAGAQGEHKFLRGFEPTFTYSTHLLFRTDAMNMISEFIHIEKENILKSFDYYKIKSPYKKY